MKIRYNNDPFQWKTLYSQAKKISFTFFGPNMYNVKDICGSKSIQKTTTNKFKQKRKSKKEILRILDENQIVMISVPTSTPRSSYIMTATRL